MTRWGRITDAFNQILEQIQTQAAALQGAQNKVNEQLKSLQREVAERAAAQEALRISEERFSKAFHGSPVPMAIQHTDGCGFLDANERFLELLDASRETVLAGGIQFWADDAMAARIHVELTDHRTVRELPASIQTLAGETREVLVSAENFELGNIPYRLLIMQDVTERSRIEVELRPDLKVIFTSGYSAELIGPEFEQEREHGFLSKPYLTEHLAKTVGAQFETLSPRRNRNSKTAGTAVCRIVV